MIQVTFCEVTVGRKDIGNMEVTCPSCKVTSSRGPVYLSRAECQYCGAHFEVSQQRNARASRRQMSASLPALNQSLTQPMLQQQLQQQPNLLYV